MTIQIFLDVFQPAEMAPIPQRSLCQNTSCRSKTFHSFWIAKYKVTGCLVPVKRWRGKIDLEKITAGPLIPAGTHNSQNENVKDLVAAVVNQVINAMRHHFDRLPDQRCYWSIKLIRRKPIRVTFSCVVYLVMLLLNLFMTSSPGWFEENDEKTSRRWYKIVWF